MKLLQTTYAVRTRKDNSDSFNITYDDDAEGTRNVAHSVGGQIFHVTQTYDDNGDLVISMKEVNKDFFTLNTLNPLDYLQAEKEWLEDDRW